MRAKPIQCREIDDAELCRLLQGGVTEVKKFLGTVTIDLSNGEVIDIWASSEDGAVYIDLYYD